MFEDIEDEEEDDTMGNYDSDWYTWRRCWHCSCGWWLDCFCHICLSEDVFYLLREIVFAMTTETWWTCCLVFCCENITCYVCTFVFGDCMTSKTWWHCCLVVRIFGCETWIWWHSLLLDYNLLDVFEWEQSWPDRASAIYLFIYMRKRRYPWFPLIEIIRWSQHYAQPATQVSFITSFSKVLMS